MHKAWESIYCPNYISGYSPFNIKNMNRAIERLISAINNREKIVICGGCNVDAICGVSSLLLMLKYLNADVEYCISPKQVDSHQGYNNIDNHIIENYISFLGAELLITVGYGLIGKEQEELCENLGIDVIITENRKIKASYKSIYINPSEENCLYRYKDLSETGVVFKLMQAIAIYYNMKSINKYLDLVLISSIAAGNKPVGENRVIFTEGIKYLENTNSIGLKAIKSFHNIKQIDLESIGAIINEITPRDGAVCRKDNARIIVELLTTNDKDRAEQITKYLHNEKNR